MALRRRAVDELDWTNLEDEIGSLGGRDRRETRQWLEVILRYLIKWRHESDHQCPSWTASIDEARSRIAMIVEDSPSLRSYPAEALAGAYRSALNDRAINYLDSSDVPKECKWTIEQVLDPEFLP
jgi:Domain of unknown function DUF29